MNGQTMMRRRNFMILSSLVGLSPWLKAKTSTPQERRFAQVKQTVAAVQAHMFPKDTALPSAEAMHTIDFLEETIFHATYDKDIRAFVIEGAEELVRREKGRFVTYDTVQKEKALRTYESDSFGSNWLGRIMTLTMEGLFGDPIYGSNIQEAGWRSLQSFGGQPRPHTRYIRL